MTFAMRASQEHYLEISTPRYAYWSAIGNLCSPHFHLKVTGFSSSSLHTTAAHFVTFAVTLHFLILVRVYSLSCMAAVVLPYRGGYRWGMIAVVYNIGKVGYQGECNYGSSTII